METPQRWFGPFCHWPVCACRKDCPMKAGDPTEPAKFVEVQTSHIVNVA